MGMVSTSAWRRYKRGPSRTIQEHRASTPLQFHISTQSSLPLYHSIILKTCVIKNSNPSRHFPSSPTYFATMHCQLILPFAFAAMQLFGTTSAMAIASGPPDLDFSSPASGIEAHAEDAALDHIAPLGFVPTRQIHR